MDTSEGEGVLCGSGSDEYFPQDVDSDILVNDIGNDTPIFSVTEGSSHRALPLEQAETQLFYQLPTFARHQSGSESPWGKDKEPRLTENSIPLLRRIVPVLPKPLESPLHKEPNEASPTFDSTTILRRLRINTLIGWTAHIVQLNRFADDGFVQALVFSLYASGPLYLDVPRIFHFFTKNFTIIPLPYERVWYAPLDMTFTIPNGLQWRMWRGMVRRKLMRAVRRREGPSPIINLLFVALCRALGIHARLVVAVPPDQVMKKTTDRKKELQFYGSGDIQRDPSLSDRPVLKEVKAFLSQPSARLKFEQRSDATTTLSLAQLSDRKTERKRKRMQQRMWLLP